MLINGKEYVIKPDANLSYAKLSYADLTGANLTGAKLSYADLTGANLSGAKLSYADLTDATGLLTARDFLASFEADVYGVITYKAFGNTNYLPPDAWKIEPGAIISETVNPDRGTICGCGVNVASLDWVKKSYPCSVYWKCRISWRDLADVVVPFGTDGKFRCARLRLLEIVK